MAESSTSKIRGQDIFISWKRHWTSEAKRQREAPSPRLPPRSCKGSPSVCMRFLAHLLLLPPCWPSSSLLPLPSLPSCPLTRDGRRRYSQGRFALRLHSSHWTRLDSRLTPANRSAPLAVKFSSPLLSSLPSAQVELSDLVQLRPSVRLRS